jgi:hypothetical protein
LSVPCAPGVESTRVDRSAGRAAIVIQVDCSWHQPACFRAAAFPSAIWDIAAVVAAHADTLAGFA